MHTHTHNLKTSEAHAAGLISLRGIDYPTPNSEQKKAVSNLPVPEAFVSCVEDKDNDAASFFSQRNSEAFKEQEVHGDASA